jgi:hypothetical protein
MNIRDVRNDRDRTCSLRIRIILPASFLSACDLQALTGNTAVLSYDISPNSLNYTEQKVRTHPSDTEIRSYRSTLDANDDRIRHVC